MKVCEMIHFDLLTPLIRIVVSHKLIVFEACHVLHITNPFQEAVS